MKKEFLNFEMIIYDQDSNTINFMYVGKPDLLTRMKYKTIQTSIYNYAFRPRNLKEFLMFLNCTKVEYSHGLGRTDFSIVRVSPLGDGAYIYPFDHLIFRFMNKYNNATAEIKNSFTREAFNIRRKKIDYYNSYFNKYYSGDDCRE